MFLEQIGIKFQNEIIDLQTALDVSNVEGEAIYFDNSIESLNIIRHSTAHLMAQAIKEIYPEVKFFVGPNVQDGFYYDFRVNTKISEDNLSEIEKKMKALSSKKYKIEKYSISKDEALKKFANDDLKLEVLNKIDSSEVSIYKQGDFEDLCRGPHLPNTKFARYFKLTKVAGAYIGGDEKREMLTRIYGIAFADKESLDDYLFMIEEAKKRDHRKLGNELDLFTFNEEAGAGLAIWLPKGARLRSKLEQILFKAHRLRGYQPVRGPEMLKSSLWQTSGHYANYGENMYFTHIAEECEYALKPMNCLGHIKVYEHSVRSYRDLPLKFFEYGIVHRHEKSGVLHGLLRVREFTQDDAHIFCTPNQIKENILEVVDFIDKIMSKFGFNYEMEISTKPEKAIGDGKIWEIATKALIESLDGNNLKFGIDEGGGAFYGPKIDIKITDALKRKWQCGTIQLDFNLPERFNLEYINEQNERIRPVMIHRAILGSFERFIAILIEHFAGEFPFFIAPTQIIFVPISETHNEYCKKLQKELMLIEVDSEVYDKNDSLNKRIRLAEKQRVPIVAIIGDEEVEKNLISIRDRRDRTQSTLNKSEFFNLIKEKMSEGNL